MACDVSPVAMFQYVAPLRHHIWRVKGPDQMLLGPLRVLSVLENMSTLSFMNVAVMGGKQMLSDSAGKDQVSCVVHFTFLPAPEPHFKSLPIP